MTLDMKLFMCFSYIRTHFEFHRTHSLQEILRLLEPPDLESELMQKVKIK